MTIKKATDQFEVTHGIVFDNPKEQCDVHNPNITHNPDGSVLVEYSCTTTVSVFHGNQDDNGNQDDSGLVHPMIGFLLLFLGFFVLLGMWYKMALQNDR